MDFISEEQALQAVLGRGDFGGIDNDALDFSQLEDYINDEGNESNIYFSEALVGGDLKLNETSVDNKNEKDQKRVPNSASPTISSTSPDLNRHPPLTISGDFISSTNANALSSTSSCGSPTVSTSQSFKLGIPNTLGNIQPVYHPSHHLPDSPPDSGSEPPFSPNNEELKLNGSGSHRSSKAAHSSHPQQRLLGSSSGQSINIMMQSPAESLKHFITYSGTQPLKHLPENTSLTIPSIHSHTNTQSVLGGGPHLMTTTSAGTVLTQLGSNIPHLPPQIGTNTNSPQFSNLVQNPHQQALISHSHLSGIYGSDELLCDSLSNSSCNNNPTKKRKLSDSPKNTVSSTVIGNGVPHIKRDPDGLSPEPTSSVILNPSEDEYSFDFNGPDNSMFMDSAYQCIRFQAFQPNTWHSLCDISMKELSPPNYRVDADKGFNFSNADEAFVCQKKNHFQVTVHIQAFGDPRYIKTAEGVKKVDNFHLHFHGAKVESPSQTIKVEQSQSDRSKKPFYPVPVDLSQEQVIKTTVGRLHFSETTSNNMRKKGKPNPDQRYFYLVVGLFAHIGDQTYPIIAHASERIIVRASNPGQFENDMELSWQKGTTPESIYHAGRVGINTDRPDESLVVHGNIRLTGHIVQPSDARAKTNVQEMDSKEQLKNVANMKIVKYEYRPEFGRKAGLQKDELRGTGVIAQEVQFILPDAVQEAGDVVLDGGEKIENFLVVNKERIFMENVGAVKELCKVTDNLETRIEELERINRKLTKLKRLDSLKSNSSNSTVTSGNSVSTNKKSNHHTKKHQNRRRTSEEVPDGFTTFCSNRVVQGTMITLILVMAFCIMSVASLYILEYHRREANERLLAGDRVTTTTHLPYSTSAKDPWYTGAPTKHPQGSSEKDTSKVIKENEFSSDLSLRPVSPSRSLPETVNNTVGPKSTFPETSENYFSNSLNETTNSADAGLPFANPTVKPQILGAPSQCYNAHQPSAILCPVFCCQSRPTVNEVIRGDLVVQPRTNSQQLSKGADSSPIPLTHENYTRVSVRAGVEGRALNLSIVDPQSLSGEDRSQNEAVPPYDIHDARLNKTRHQNENYYNRSSNMYMPSSGSYLDQASTVQNSDNSVGSKSPHENGEQNAEPQSVSVSENEASNEEKDEKKNSSSRKRRNSRPLRYRRSDVRSQAPKTGKELFRAVESIRVLELNAAITTAYCNNLSCTWPVYNYLIPISKYMNLEYLTIQFNFTTPVNAYHCEAKEKTSCNSAHTNEVTDEQETQNNNSVEGLSYEWSLDVGRYMKSVHKFRIIARGDENTVPCTLPDDELGKTIIEYNLTFLRKCDK